MSNDTELRDFLKRETAAMRRGGNVLLIVGIILIAVIITYFSIILSILKRDYQTNTLLDIAFNQVETAIDNATPQLESWILTNAPALMDQAEKTILEKAPEIRVKAEQMVTGLADRAAERIHQELSVQISTFIRDHAQPIRLALEAAGDIQKSQTAKEDLKGVLLEEFERVAQEELDPKLPDVLSALKDIQDELHVLLTSPTTELNEEQRLEYELIQIAFTLWSRAYSAMQG